MIAVQPEDRKIENKPEEPATTPPEAHGEPARVTARPSDLRQHVRPKIRHSKALRA